MLSLAMLLTTDGPHTAQKNSKYRLVLSVFESLVSPSCAKINQNDTFLDDRCYASNNTGHL